MRSEFSSRTCTIHFVTNKILKRIQNMTRLLNLPYLAKLQLDLQLANILY